MKSMNADDGRVCLCTYLGRGNCRTSCSPISIHGKRRQGKSHRPSAVYHPARRAQPGDLRSTGRTSTLGDMIVKCDCGATRTMSGATQSDNFVELTCTGHHPFKPSHRNEKCKTKKVIPSQRGASNVYFPVIKSAISIPPWINPLFNLIDMHLRDIELLEEYGVPDPEGNVYNKYFAENYSREEFDEALKRRRENIKEFTEIKQMEYNAITHHDDPLYASNRRHFKAEEDELPLELKKYFSRVIRITRMREVKVLLGFIAVSYGIVLCYKEVRV